MCCSWTDPNHREIKVKYFPQTPSSPEEAAVEDGGGWQVDAEDSQRPRLSDRGGDGEPGPAHNRPGEGREGREGWEDWRFLFRSSSLLWGVSTSLSHSLRYKSEENSALLSSKTSPRRVSDPTSPPAWVGGSTMGRDWPSGAAAWAARGTWDTKHFSTRRTSK